MGKMHGFDIRVVKENTEKMAKVMGFDNEMVEKGKKGGGGSLRHNALWYNNQRYVERNRRQGELFY